MTCIKTKCGKDAAVLCFPDVFEDQDDAGKMWRWEHHAFCGPTFLDEHGNPFECPPEDSPAWQAFERWWSRQGRARFGLQTDPPTPMELT